MSVKSAKPSPEGIARSNRQRLAAEEGARAMADAEKQGVEVRRTWPRFESCAKRRKRPTQLFKASLPAPTPAKRKKKLPQE